MLDKLEAYLSGLNVSEDSKRKIRHDVKDFMKMLGEQEITAPGFADIETYQQKLKAENKSDGTIRDSVSRVKKFLAYAYASNEEASQSTLHEAHGVNVPAVSEAISISNSGQRKDRRFSLLLSASMYEALEWLSQYDRCSVASVIVKACTEYTAKRKGDIDYIAEQMTLLKRSLEQRKAERF